MAIKKPIFIVGSGRSGTTVFYNFLATHPEVCWFSNLGNKLININQVPFLHRLIDLPFIGGLSKNNIISKRYSFIRPSEGENIYDYCGFEKSIKTDENNLNFEIEKKI